MTLNIVMDGPKTMDIWGGPKTSPETKFGVAMPSPSGVTPETTFCFSHNDLYIWPRRSKNNRFVGEPKTSPQNTNQVRSWNAKSFLELLLRQHFFCFNWPIFSTVGVRKTIGFELGDLYRPVWSWFDFLSYDSDKAFAHTHPHPQGKHWVHWVCTGGGAK